MSKTEQENEVKFLVRDLTAIGRKLKEQGAILTAPRVHEINLRFDTPQRDLARQRRVLRLRQDAGAVMTFKGPAKDGLSISSRQEIEFQVSDFGAARRLLEALGYELSIMYEKYRTTYMLSDLVIVLDEMPFGNFIEIEGPDAVAISAASEKLGLDWNARSTSSYLMLFETVKTALNMDAKNLSFVEFEATRVKNDHLGLLYADD